MCICSEYNGIYRDFRSWLVEMLVDSAIALVPWHSVDFLMNQISGSEVFLMWSWDIFGWVSSNEQALLVLTYTCKKTKKSCGSRCKVISRLENDRTKFLSKNASHRGYLMVIEDLSFLWCRNCRTWSFWPPATICAYNNHQIICAYIII